MKQEIWLANRLLILHAFVVGITVAGGVAFVNDSAICFNENLRNQKG
jgi:hypothetical protein